MQIGRCLALCLMAAAIVSAQPADELPYGKIVQLEGPIGLRDGRSVMNWAMQVADLGGSNGGYWDEETGILALRGRPEEVELVEWFTSEFVDPSGAAGEIVSRQFPSALPGRPGPPPPAPDRYRPEPNEIVRILFVPRSGNERVFGNLVNMAGRISGVRSMGGLTEIPTDLNQYAVIMRGNAAAVDTAEWIVRDVLDPPDSRLSHERALEASGQRLRIFHLPAPPTEGRLNAMVRQLKVVTGAEAFGTAPPSVILVWGSPEQLQAAEDTLPYLLN